MEKGVSRSWTPGREELLRELLTTCHTFAERHILLCARDLLKYDGRSKESKRAANQGRLRLATATDQDLEELAKLEQKIFGEADSWLPQRLEELRQLRNEIGEKGIEQEDLK